MAAIAAGRILARNVLINLVDRFGRINKTKGQNKR